MSPPSESSGNSSDVALHNHSENKTKRVLRSRRSKERTHPHPQQQPPPRRSLIRKRPVSFGNPALGTYHGCLYTLDVVGKDFVPTSPPIIEGAESIERIVAMVDVPPEQVPEGILNLARSHRPYLHHVRIVIAENSEQFPELSRITQPTASSQEESKDEVTQNDSGYSGPATPYVMPAPIVSEDADRNHQMNSSDNDGSAFEGREETNHSTDIPIEKEDNNSDLPTRTYLVLLELCSKEAAEGFVQDLHGKPYTSLDETQTCSVYRVLSLSGENGVSLLSPFFAPSTTATSSKATTTVAANTAISDDITQTATSSTAYERPLATTATTSSMLLNATPMPPISAAATAPAVTTHTEDYNCAVCLEHMNLTETEILERSSILTTVCNHTFHLDCLLQWQDSPCPVCRYDHSGLNETLSQCHICGTTEHNYVCLICGVVSCGGPPMRSVASASGPLSAVTPASACRPAGMTTRTSNAGGTDHRNDNNASAVPPMETSRRLSQSHARKHYDETLHAYSLDTETQHVWDFAGQGYVHRLLQNKEDGKLVEVHNPADTSSHERTLSPGLSDAQEGEVLHRKLEGFANQYYTLLKSQLEQQRSYYQGRLEELRRESLMKKKSQTSDLINALKQEKTQLSKRLASMKAKHSKILEDIAFLKNMNESLESNKEPLKEKVKRAQWQRAAARDQIQECLPVLEEKVTMLMLQLTGDQDNSDNLSSDTPVAAANLSNASEDVECAPESTSEPFNSSNTSDTTDNDSKPAAKW